MRDKKDGVDTLHPFFAVISFLSGILYNGGAISIKYPDLFKWRTRAIRGTMHRELNEIIMISLQ